MTDQKNTMRAIVYDRYGSPELREIEQPDVADDGVLIRVHASSVNPVDWYGMVGRPYISRLMGVGLRKPKSNVLGSDLAGRVEAVGGSVTQFRPGEEVFGAKTGAFAEYVSVAPDRLVPKPANLTFEQAAAVPIAALTALQALRDKGGVQPGHRVLINGASGGVGTFAVQIAKSFGAEVTGVCSTRNVDLVRSIGADHVVDYTREDFTAGGSRFDLMIDIAGSRSFRECRRVLAPNATLVIVGGPKTNRLLGPLSHMLKTRLASIGKSQKAVFFVAKIKQDDLIVLRDLLEAEKVIPVIDRRYELSETPDAFRYLGEGHAAGKVVITV
jgi:NADPH:quinone reductase-like Zn-dependent oxidoreductase